MPHELHEIAENLRGTARTSYELRRDELKRDPCAWPTYRLRGGPIVEGGPRWSDFCCVHLHENWRLIYQIDEASEEIQVLALGEESKSADADDIYKQFAAAVGLEPRPRLRGSDKEPCCESSTPRLQPVRRTRIRARARYGARRK